MFEALLKILPLTANAYQWLLGRNDKKKENFASLCERIGEVMESFANANEDQRKSKNLCGELRVYVPGIREMAKEILESNQLEEMAKELDDVCTAWSKHSEILEKGVHASDRDLLEIDGAAGHFRGLAKLVRTM